MRPSRFVQELQAARRPTSYADLLARGEGRGRLAGPRWERTSRGRYRPSVTELSPTQRILDATAVLPAGGAIGGWAAAYVQGVDWLDGRDPRTGDLLPVLLCVGQTIRRTARPGLVYSRAPLSGEEVRTVSGVPVTSGARTALDGVRRSSSEEEALCFVDALGAHQLVTRRQLAACLESAHGSHGRTRLRALLPLFDPRVKSTWESRLRYCWVREAGLPAPLVNRPVFDRNENLLGIPDLLDDQAGLVTEFDGSGHRERRQHRRDNHREERFEGHNLAVTRVDSLDLRERPALVDRLRAARCRAAGRDRSRDRWTLVEPDWWLEQQDPELSDEDKEAMYG